MRVLCLDQATKVSGYSVWDNGKLVKYGHISSDVRENNPFLRMRIMGNKIVELLKKYSPDYVGIEGVVFQRNYCTYSQLSQMQGVIFEILFENEIDFTVIEASAWKSFCGIKGKKRVEQKLNTIKMVKEKFGLDVTEDEADAIGIGMAVCNRVEE